MFKKKRESAVVFLGGGRITSALCAGLRLAAYDGSTLVYDRNPEKLRALRKESGVEIAGDLRTAVECASTLVIAVRPISIEELLRQVAECGAARCGLCVSLAAGIPLTQLRRGLPEARWVRAMPSPVCRVGRGLTALCFDRHASASDRSQARRLFQLVGQVVDVNESQLDAFTIAFSPSHGYHALATLAKAVQSSGLDRKTALTAAAHALCDGVLYWRQGGLNLDALLHEAATPGGTAAATMAAMDKAGYERVVTKGLAAGIRRARMNAKL